MANGMQEIVGYKKTNKCNPLSLPKEIYCAFTRS